jgi:maleate isomerase
VDAQRDGAEALSYNEEANLLVNSTSGFRLKVGVVTPSVNTVVQPEYDAMRPFGVTNHVSRIHIAERQIDNDDDYRAVVHAIDVALDAAVESVLTCEPDCVVLGVSIEAVYGGGVDAASRLQERLVAQFGDAAASLVHAADALPAALRALGIDGGEVGVLTPYMPAADADLRLFVKQVGYEYGHAVHLQSPSTLAIARTPEKTLRRALGEIAETKPKAIIQFGANLEMARLAAEAERWLEIPVVAVNTATYWHALRTNGVLDQRGEFGSLFAEC